MDLTLIVYSWTGQTLHSGAGGIDVDFFWVVFLVCGFRLLLCGAGVTALVTWQVLLLLSRDKVPPCRGYHSCHVTR